jgi:1,4-dihydroxy-2-naphthoate octaprenyltransferase
MKITAKQSIIAWLNLTRLGAAARGMLPFFLGTVIAWSAGYQINILIFFLSSTAVLSIMVSTFLVNEYYDYETDTLNKDFHRLSGGSRVLVIGLVPKRQALYSAYWLLGLAAVIGLVLYFYFKTGPLTIPLGALAILIGYFYTAKPLNLSYRSIGELAIWFTCGWLATILGYYLQTGQITTMVSLVSLPGATSVFLLILINEIPDIGSDSVSGKRSLAVILGKRNALLLYSLLLVGCWLNMLAIIPFGIPWNTGLFSFALWPIIWLNLLDIKRSPADRQTLEKLSVRTMLFDHLITFIYSAAFILVGINAGGIDRELGILILCYLVIFVLEGISLLFSSRTQGQYNLNKFSDSPNN